MGFVNCEYNFVLVFSVNAQIGCGYFDVRKLHIST